MVFCPGEVYGIFIFIMALMLFISILRVILYKVIKKPGKSVRFAE